MIDGLTHLTVMRRGGITPPNVWLTLYGEYKKPIKPDSIELVVIGDVSTDDFRPFKGLDVTFCVDKWTAQAEQCLDKLKEHAYEISVLVAEYGDTIGYFWSAEHGNIELDDYKWVKQFHDARKSLCRTEKETAERLRLEAEAISHVPSLGVNYGSLTH